MKLKVCGITDLSDARYLAGLGVDYLGFIQHEESPRYVDPKHAGEMIEWIYGPEPVGVFVNDDAETVNRVCEQAGFTVAQLHGTESVETVEAVEVPVIKAVHVVHDASSEQLRQIMEPYAEHVDYFLLDTHRTNMWGGTGESFNWRLARDLAEEFPLFLAGGLTAENLEEAVETMRPAGIDVSSSLESEPGKKDFGKIDAFFDVYQQITSTSA